MKKCIISIFTLVFVICVFYGESLTTIANAANISGVTNEYNVVASLATPTTTATNTAQGIKITWGAVENAEKYVVYQRIYNKSTKKYSSWKAIKTTTGTSYVDTSVKIGVSYSYAVRAVNGTVKSKYVATKGLTYNITPTINVSNATNGIKVTWTKVANATGYAVYSSTYNAKTKKWSGWKLRGTAKANAAYWTDTKVQSGTIYKYTVRAVNGSVKGNYNKNGVSLTRLAQPTTKIANAATGIKVSWSKVAGATGYRVYRSELVDGKWAAWKTMGTAKNTASSWVDRRAVSGTTYRYAVRAVRGSVLSSYKATSSLMYLAQPTVTVKTQSNGFNVSWTKSEGATQYVVLRSEYVDSEWSSWDEIETTSLLTLTDTQVLKNVKYKYTVKAINTDFESTYESSPEIYVNTIPPSQDEEETGGNTGITEDDDTNKNEAIIYNLHNPDTDIEGKYFDIHGTGFYAENSMYCVTEKIPVLPNQTLRFMKSDGEYFNCRMIAEFDCNGNFLGGVENVNEYTQHDNVAFLIFSLRRETERDAMIADEKAESYIPYGEGNYFQKIGNGNVATIKSGSTTSLTIDNFPKYLKTAQSFSFKCNFDGGFKNIRIGKGFNTYRGHWFCIDGENIIHHKYETDDIVVTTVTHNISVTDYLSVLLDIDGEKAVLTINSTGGTFTHTFDFEYEACGTPFVTSEQEIKNVVFNATSKSFNKEIWMFGDSYFGVTDARVIGQLKNLGVFEDVLIDGLAGQVSSGAFEDLEKALDYGTPKYLVWALGMNDDDKSHQEYLSKVKALCREKNIELVLATIPTVPTRSKETITTNVRNSGYRYIDFYNAVDANEKGEWYAGYLSADGVHPTELGAKALATQILIDFPELLKYRD